MKRQINNTGFMMVSMAVASIVGFLSLYWVSRGVQNLNNFQRGITSNADIDTAATLIHLLIDSNLGCSKTGLIGLDLSSLFFTVPKPIPVTLALAGSPNNQAGIIASAGTSIGTTRKVSGLNLISLTEVSAATGNYIGTLELTTTVVGTATTSRSPTKRFLLNLLLDGSHQVVACGDSVVQQGFCGSIVGGFWDLAQSKCRVGVESRKDDPGSPPDGQMWLRTDL